MKTKRQKYYYDSPEEVIRGHWLPTWVASLAAYVLASPWEYSGLIFFFLSAATLWAVTLGPQGSGLPPLEPAESEEEPEEPEEEQGEIA